MLSRPILSISDVFHRIDEFRKKNPAFVTVVFDQRDVKGLNKTHGIQKTDLVLKSVGEIISQEMSQNFPCISLQGPQGRHYVCIKTKANDMRFDTRLKNTIAQVKASLTHHFSGAVDIRYARVSAPEDAYSTDDVILTADQLLEEGKEKGVSESFVEDAERFQQWTTRHALKTAISHGEFILHYQPIVCTHSHEITTVEALSRWLHPTDGLRSPAHFITELTKHQLMSEFGIEVCNRAIQQLSYWRDQNPGAEDLVMSINVSLQQLKTPSFYDALQDLLVCYNVPPHNIQLEVTEDLIAEDATVAQLRRLSDFGILLAIDDFGSGTSNISRLRQIHADVVKIDKQIMRDCCESNDHQFLHSLITMCRAMSPSTKVIVEGVETEQHEEIVRNAGADAIQGFLFHKPSPAESVDLTSYYL